MSTVTDSGVSIFNSNAQQAVGGHRPQSSPALMPPHRSIPHHFKEQVARLGPELAVVDETCSVTYDQLNAAANYVAGELVRAGFKRGQVVALMFGREAKAIAAMLGILKAGGAYLPVDAGTPLKRVQSILISSGATLLLSSQQLAESSGVAVENLGGADSAGNCRILYLDWDVNRPPAVLPNPAAPGPDDLAYVLYTSGSTGTPKGAMIEHRNVLNLVESLEAAILGQYHQRLRIALVAPFVFDASVQQIFSSLLLGHTLYIVPEHARRDGTQLADFYVRYSIDVSDGTPAHLKILSRATSSVGKRLPVKHFIIGGEMLRSADVSNFFGRFSLSRFRVSNIYGTAECAVDSVSYEIDPSELDGGQETVPVGRPLIGTAVYVLDDELRPVPAGNVGELCIAGAGVGRGYMNASDLTAERFVRNPHGGGLLYRTGDLAYFRPDGVLVLKGRKDKQLKVRGYRIEPAEIEAKILGFAETTSRVSRQLPILGQYAAPMSAVRCKECLLSAAYPGVTLGEDGVCSVCRNYKRYAAQALEFFRPLQEFEELMKRAGASKRGAHDCMLLYSGGKDSTYVLYKLLDKGLKVLTFTFDNGFISRAAFENIERVTRQFGVEHVTLSADRMDEVFAESLKSDKTVCGGCFRALTSLSTRLAEERGINVVLTGLSRGQTFDTKLKQLFEVGIYDQEEIERRLVSHRKLYHLRNDPIASLLDVKVSEDSIDSIYFVDYFRYDEASGPEVMAYLHERDEFWRRPEDTGFCSTNCRINDVGIYVHQLERGYHNYEAPLSWDIRLGVLTREEGLKKLEGVLSEDSARRILNKIGYSTGGERLIHDAAVVKLADESLAAYVVSRDGFSAQVLREHLRKELPEYMIPAHFVRVDALPMTTNGKLDTHALPEVKLRGAGGHTPDSSETETETRLRKVWEEVFQSKNIASDADFFELGGDSLKATMLIFLLEEEWGLELPPATVFDHPSIRKLAVFIDSRGGAPDGAMHRPVLLREGENATRHLFFIHDASGDVGAVGQLSKLLTPEVNVWGIRADELREDALPSIEQMALQYIEQMRGIQDGGPWHVGGWSFGGVVAYEIARQLQEAGQTMELLAVIDSPFPDPCHWEAVLASFIGELRGAFPQVAEMVKHDEDVGREVLLLLGRIEHYTHAADRIKRHLPDTVAHAIIGLEEMRQEQLFDSLKRIFSYVSSLARYQTDAHVPVSVELYQAASETDGEQVGRWGELISDCVRRHVLCGDHRSILSPPNVNKLAEKLNEKLRA